MMLALSSFGYWRTFSVRIACSPAMMITRLTTMASTGRRTKMSVNFTTRSYVRSAIFGGRRELRVDEHLVAHRERDAVSELEGAGRHELLARLQAVEHGDEVAARFTELHE